MKSALVLGLALTASAFSADQFDNELIIAPTDQFGNIKNYPRNIRFDEQADDELLVKRPGYLQVADDELRIAPLDEFGRIKPYPPNVRFDEEGNDLFSFKIPRYRNLTKGFPGLFADDEYVMAPLDGTGKYHRQRKFDDVATRKIYDDEGDNELAFSPYRTTVYADDELMRGPYQRRRRSEDIKRRNFYPDEADNEYAARGKAAAAKKYRPGLVEHVKKHPETVFFDEDDELIARPSYLQIADDELIKPPRHSKNKNKGNVMYDDQADDELHSKNKMSPKLFGERRAEALRRDDEVNNELHWTQPPKPAVFQRIAEKLIGAPADKKQTGKTMHDDEVDDELLVRPDVPYVAADDELLLMSPRLFTERGAEALRRDDEVDNELAWSGLIQNIAEGVIRVLPSQKKQTGKVMHDDEVDDELLVRPDVPYVAADDEFSLISPRLFTERGAEALRRDDEADDELAWLDELLQQAPYNGALFRSLDDNELRAEKPAHLKGQKMKDFRDHEMPEIKGKVKPLGDGGFLPFN